MKKFILLSTLLFYYLPFLQAQPGSLDSAFGNNGIVIKNVGERTINSSNGIQVLVGSDKSIYILFSTDYYGSFITKRDQSGAIDKSYGTNGFSDRIKASVLRAAFQGDGKMVVCGGSALFRFNSNGSLDKTFGNNGFQPLDFGHSGGASAMAVQSDGKIVVAGYTYGDHYNFATERYNSNGSPDSSFSNGSWQIEDFGYNNGSASTIAVQDNGKIVVAGFSSYQTNNNSYYIADIARYNTNGTLDSTFSKDGKQTTKLKDKNGNLIDFYPTAAAIQSDEKILIAGTGVLARYNNDGTLDNTFSDDGIQTRPFDTLIAVVLSMTIQADGKIVIAGYTAKGSFDFALARYNTDGILDNTFGKEGVQTTDFSGRSDYGLSVAIQSDGKILVGGSEGDCEFDCLNEFAVARYNTDGTLDNTFDKDGKLTGNYLSGNTTFNKIAVQKNGKIVVLGNKIYKKNITTSFIARYNTNGTIDKTFGKGGVKAFDFNIASIALQSDGKIVAVGTIVESQQADFAIYRFNGDGSIDSTFSDDGRQTTDFDSSYDMVAAVAIHTDGKIVVAGTADIERDDYSNHDFAVARYNADGSLDRSFSDDGKVITDLSDQEEYAKAVAILSDGSIIVGGLTQTFRHEYDVLIKYNPDGSLGDDVGGGDDGQSSGIIAIAIKKNDEIVAINNNAFHGINGLNASSSSVAVQEDDKIIIAGNTNSDGILVRYSADGSVDSTFGNLGIQLLKASSGERTSLVNIATTSGKLYAAGWIGTGIGYYAAEGLGVLAKYSLDGHAPPIVHITTPINDTIYTAPAKITIKVNTIPVNAVISKVEFYNDAALLHTDTIAPYEFQWKNVQAGSYILTAKATDNFGFEAMSDAVKVSVVSSIPPTVNIINPVNNKTYPGPATITLEAAAKDPDGSIAKVEFYNGSTLISTVSEFPYTFVWEHIPKGKYALTAKATDNIGASAISGVVNFSIVANKHPTVNITNPANDEYFTAPANISLMAAAEDADGRVVKVEFYNGDTLLKSVRKLPYTYEWQNVPSGIYTITAVATDGFGAKTTSDPVTVIVYMPNATIASKPSVDTKSGIADAAGLILAPNPAHNTVNIYTGGLQQNKQVTVTVISAAGVVMKTMQSNSMVKVLQLNVSSLPPGLYGVKLLCEDKVLYKQFLKL